MLWNVIHEANHFYITNAQNWTEAILHLTALGLQIFFPLFISAMTNTAAMYVKDKYCVLNPCFVLTFFKKKSKMYTLTHVSIEVAAYLCSLMQRDRHVFLCSNPDGGALQAMEESVSHLWTTEKTQRHHWKQYTAEMGLWQPKAWCYPPQNRYCTDKTAGVSAGNVGMCLCDCVRAVFTYQGLIPSLSSVFYSTRYIKCK